MSDRSRLYAALARLRNAKTTKEANAAQAEVMNIGLQAAKRVADPRLKIYALKALDADIRMANQLRLAA